METQGTKVNPPLIGNGDIPWWVKFIYTFGIPAALSVYLIWLMATRIEGKIDNLQDQIRMHQTDTVYNSKSNDAQIMKLNESLITLQKTCVNGANNQAERDNCFNTGIK